jgi:hypothetical protein
MDAAQHQFALFRALPRSVRTPVCQNFPQIPDRNIHGRCQIDFAASGVFDAVVAKPYYFSTHSSPLESLRA